MTLNTILYIYVLMLLIPHSSSFIVPILVLILVLTVLSLLVKCFSRTLISSCMTQKFGMKGVKSPRLMPAGLGRRQCNSSTRKYWSIVLICIMVSWWSLSLSCNIEVTKVGTWRNDGRTESEFQKIANKIGSLDRFWTISHCCSCCSSPFMP